MRHIVTPFVASLASPHFSTLAHKRHDFRKKELLNIKWVFWFSLQLSSKTFLFLRRIRRDIVINVKTSSCKVPVILIWFQRNLSFLDRFSKKVLISSFIKIRPVGAYLYHANGRTDMAKQTVAFRNFRNAPKHSRALALQRRAAEKLKITKDACLCQYPTAPPPLRTPPYLTQRLFTNNTDSVISFSMTKHAWELF
jgi:hypothetical protein